MPLPLAHALVGASIGVTLAPPERRRRGMIVGAVLGISPDVDFVLGALHVVRWGWHHGVTHSIAFALIVGVVAARAFGLRPLACVLAALSHPVLDYVITESAGVARWWPVTSRRVKLGIDALSYYPLAHASHGAIAWAKLCAAELVLFGPLFALAIVVSGRRPGIRTASSQSR